GPSFLMGTKWNLLPGDPEYVIYTGSFREFVRFKFGQNQKFVSPNNSVDGSRGSEMAPWHFTMYAKRGPGKIDAQDAYVLDDPKVLLTASAPTFAGKGAGYSITTPSMKAKTLSAVFAATQLVQAVYDKNSDSWKV